MKRHVSRTCCARALPTTPHEERWRDAPSAVLLAEIRTKARARGWSVGNVDVTVVAERPHLGSHRNAMAARIAEVLGVDPDAVNVKATTHEGLGALGRGEGIAAMAVATVDAPEA